jgi:nitroreductase
MDIFEAIKGRRSVREFLPDEVSQEDLERILDMARYAPTAGNAQPWKFLLVRDEENKAGLKEVVQGFLRDKIEGMDCTEEEKTERQEGFRQFLEKILMAPASVFVFVDANQYPDLVIYDGALAVQNMMLAAHALGYGTSFQTTIFPEELVRGFFSVPDHFKFICAVPIGRPAARPKMPEKKELASFIWAERCPD